MIDDIIEEYAHTSRLREIPAAAKITVTAGAVLVTVTSQSLVPPLFVAVTMVLGATVLAGIPLRIYARLLVIPLFFALTSGCVILLVTGGGETLVAIPLAGDAFGITSASLNLAVLVISRTIAGMCALFFLALTTPVTDLFPLMQRMRLPQEFIDLSMLIYRFIFILIGEAIAIYDAQLMRNGYRGFRMSLHAFSLLASMLFIRAWEKGEALVVAMDARCYDGRFEPGVVTGPVSGPVIATVAAYLCACCVILALTMPGVVH